MVVAKSDGHREEFNRDKLTRGVMKACAKRPVSLREIEKLVEDIEVKLQGLGHAEIPATLLGDMVMERLVHLDRVAYVRFASVYRDYQDIDSFEQVVKDLREDNEQLSLMEDAPPPPKTGRLRGRRWGRVPSMPQSLGQDVQTGGSPNA